MKLRCKTAKTKQDILKKSYKHLPSIFEIALRILFSHPSQSICTKSSTVYQTSGNDGKHLVSRSMDTMHKSNGRENLDGTRALTDKALDNFDLPNRH
jgi:hypothetical protein